MKKTIPVILAVLIILGIGIWFLTGRKSQSPQTTNTLSAQPTAATANQPQSLKDLLLAGIPQTCTVSQTSENNKSDTTIYISGGQMRGDVQAKAGDTNIVTHMIIRDNTTYVWTDGQTTGYKMAYDPNTPVPTSAPGQPQGVNPDVKVDYHCSPWISDAGKFILPSNITFTDLKSLLPSLPAAPKVSGAPAQSDQCAACGYLTGDAKTQCLKTLGCK